MHQTLKDDHKHKYNMDEVMNKEIVQQYIEESETENSNKSFTSNDTNVKWRKETEYESGRREDLRLVTIDLRKKSKRISKQLV